MFKRNFVLIECIKGEILTNFLEQMPPCIYHNAKLMSIIPPYISKQTFNFIPGSPSPDDNRQIDKNETNGQNKTDKKPDNAGQATGNFKLLTTALIAGLCAALLYQI